MVTVAEKPRGTEPAPTDDPAAEQLAARIRAVDGSQNVSGKDVSKWSVSERTAVGKLLDNPPKRQSDVHERFPAAVTALGKTRAERLVAELIAKRLETYERQRDQLEEAFQERRELAVRLQEAKAEASEANKAYSDLKEEYEAADQLIINLAANARTGQKTLPMEIPKNTPAKANGKPSSNGKAAPQGGDRADTAPIEELGLGKKVAEGMHAADLKTVGSLIKFIGSDEWWHRKIKGVGEASVDKITDALNEWRGKNPSE